MVILLIVFHILSSLSAYNVRTASPVHYWSYYRSPYSYILNPSFKERPYLSLFLFIQLGRYTTKCLQKFACLFYPTSLAILLYVCNQGPKSHLGYLVSLLIQIYPQLSYYCPYPHPCPYPYLYCCSILLYCFTPSYLRPFYPYYYSTVLLAPVPIKRL